jgi:hypothetical protein
VQKTDDLTRQVKLGALSFSKVLRALTDGPCTAHELREASGLSVPSLHGLMLALRKESLVHISDWETDATGRESLRVYKLGPGKDKARRKKSKAQITRDWRMRKTVQAIQAIVPLSRPANNGSRPSASIPMTSTASHAIST